MASKITEIRVVGKDEASKTFETISNNSAKATSAMEGHASRIGGAFSKLDNLLGQFGIPFSGVLSEIGGKLGEFEQKATSSFQKVAEVGKLATAATVVGLAAVGIESVHLADQFEKSHANLQTAITNSGHKMSEFRTEIDLQTASAAKLGINMTEYEKALAVLVTATNDPAKALAYMGVVEDGAAKTGKSLAEVSLLVAKGLEGQTRPLKQAGIDLPIMASGALKVEQAQSAVAKATENVQNVEQKVTDGRLKGAAASDALKAAYEKLTGAQQALSDKQNAGVQIVTALGQRWSGAAAAQAETFQGKTKALTAELENMGIKIGLWLIPKIQALIGAISDVINWFEQHRAVAEALGIVLGTVLVTAITAYIASMVAAAAATIAATWPVLAVIAVVAALVVGIYELWTNWNQIWSWVRDHPAYAAVIGILGTIVTGGLLPIVLGVVWLAKNWDDVWNTIKDIAETVASDISAALQPIVDTIEAIVGAARAAARAISSIPSHIPGAGIIGDALGAIGLSEGGFVPGVGNTDSVPAMLTPGEFVVSKDMQSRGQWGPLGRAPIAASAGGVGGDQTVVVKLLLDGKTIHESLLRRNRQTGSLRLT